MAADFTLEIAGVKGESLQKGYEGQIEIESFSWGETQQGSHGGGGGGSAAKVSFQDMHVTTRVGKHSTEVARHCANGKHISKITLNVRKSGEEKHQGKPYYKVILEDVIVSSYQSGGSDGSNALPVDQFSFNFAKIEYNYALQKKEGGLEAPQILKVDIKTGVVG